MNLPDYRTDVDRQSASSTNRRVFGVTNPRIISLEARDVRFPTSLLGDGSDAMHPDPDYSAAYVVLRTDVPGLEGHGLTFTIGSGTEICVVAARAFEPMVVGKTLDAIRRDMRGFWRTLVADSKLRWLGPEKGVVHLAAAAVVNAVWDLWAKLEEKPLWKLLVDLTPEELVACVDFSYISDALDEAEALELLRNQASGRAAREAELRVSGYPAYTTSAGWLGYDDARIQELATQAIAEGFTQLKIKVGRDLDDDVRRARLIRETIGPERRLMMDANQAWSVPEAVAAVARLRELDPWWIEEPTSPDDILGHARIRSEIAPVRVATGEHVQNRIVFKQLFQAQAIDVCQIDACRLGGVNEVVAVLLLAAHFGVPVCPHAGGVGLCELVQHLSSFDFVAVSGSLDDVVVEYVDHLHEHFVDPVRAEAGRYLAPERPGYSAEIRRESLREFRFPDGPVWSSGQGLADGRAQRA
jgi:L-fuconate dehydratase